MAQKGRTRRHRGGSQKWAIVQYDDRKLTDVDKEMMNRNNHYAHKWGHEYIFKKDGYEGISPYWRKVFLVKDILGSDKYGGIVWLDTDATIYKMDTDLNSLLEEGKHFYKSTDNTPGNKGFCAGVWFVLNTPIGKEIISKWAEKYNGDKWRKNNTNLKRPWKTNGEWAGQNYEQGSFIDNILPVYGQSMKNYSDKFLQGLEPSEDTFILHFYFMKDKRKDFVDKHPLPMILSVGGRRTRKRSHKPPARKACIKLKGCVRGRSVPK
jgi:hypothetical protein